MKRENIKFIFGIVLGVLVSGITVFAINISSANINYDNTNSGLEATTVEGAINELYQDASKKMAINTFGEAVYSETRTVMNSSKTNTLNLPKGKYIVSYDVNYPCTNSNATYNDNHTGDDMIECDNCIKTHLSGKVQSLGGRGYANSLYTVLLSGVDYIEITSESEDIYLTYGWVSSVPFIISFQATPINE